MWPIGYAALLEHVPPAAIAEQSSVIAKLTVIAALAFGAYMSWRTKPR